MSSLSVDRATIFDLLAKAEGHVIDGEQEITRLCKIIAHLNRGGPATSEKQKTALELLRSVKTAQRAKIIRRDQLKSVLKGSDAERIINQVRSNAAQ